MKDIIPDASIQAQSLFKAEFSILVKADFLDVSKPYILINQRIKALLILA